MRRAGLLIEPIEILQISIEKNDYGEEVETISTKCKTRARVIHNKGGRKRDNEEITYAYNKIFVVRFYVDIDDFDRVRWNNKVYRILEVDVDKVRQEKSIYTEQINE